ncbi:erythroferrone [Pipistrellus kuhlii]|uniref:Erythroferrone n=1 Tax=Pipistrellus kuhlii TaxID=59472 RepID=A0A7J7XUH2_PIPKU|nr:erythroferrone [Pipistrellus kuhlii]KAF6353198.1 erythroferrone [Pipistrellus kuhlii]
MASAGARLLLCFAGLLAVTAAAASDLGVGAAAAPPGSRVRRELPADDAAGVRLRRATTRRPESTTERTAMLDSWEAWKALLRNNAKAKKSKGQKLESCPQILALLDNSRPVNSSELVKELRRLIEEYVPLRERMLLGLASHDAEKATGNRDSVDELAEALVTSPRIMGGAFHCRLRQKLSVERRTLHELGGYYLPESEGAFFRGLGLNLTSGQYRAPVGGFYALAATLHVALPQHRKPEQRHPRDRLRLLICIESQCQNHTSLEAVIGLQSGSELFTISVNGVLYLQMGQYISVFLDNASGSLVTVQGGSQFSALLLGI